MGKGSLPPVLRRLLTAMNEHDLEGFLDCFDPEYVSEQPLHTEAGFRGRDRIRRNWSWKLRPGSDFRAAVVAFAVDGEFVWTEWRWNGTRNDGSILDDRGVIVYRIRDDRVVSGRLYVEPFAG
jgi:ketosteroid isomerase-like protein